MTRSGRAGWILLAAALVAFFAVPTAEARHRKARHKTIPVADLPEWLQEALRLPSPTTSADTVCLHEEYVVEPLAAGGVRKRERYAARILTTQGMKQFTSAMHFYRKGDTLGEFSAWTIDPQGKALVLATKNSIVDKPALAGYSVYVDSRYRSVKLSGLRAGYVVAWEYSLTEQFDAGADEYVFGSVRRPTLLSRFSVRVPEGWHLEAVVQRGENLQQSGERGRIVFSGTGLTPPPLEQHRPPPGQILPRVWLRWWSPDGEHGYESWDAVGKWYEKLSSPVLHRAGEAAEVSRKLAPKDPSRTLDALAEAFAFAARQVRYVSIQIGIGGYKPSAPAVVCKNRFGDCKDKSFLLRSLVSPWGLKTYPLLVRTRSLGPTAERVPTPSQFNHCIAAVTLPDGLGEDLWPVVEVEGLGRLILLDATDNLGSPWALPKGDQGTVGLLVHPGGGRLITIPVQPPSAAVIHRSLSAMVNEGGVITLGTLVEEWSGTEAAGVRSYWSDMTDQERQAAVARDLQDRFPRASVVDYELEKEVDGGLGLRETTRIRGGVLGKRMADLIILEPGRVGYGVVSGNLAPPPRRWPYRPGFPHEEKLDVVLQLPAAWRPEALPEDLQIDTEDLSARGHWSFEDGRLIYQRTAELKTTEIPPERYESFRQTVARFGGADRQGIALIR